MPCHIEPFTDFAASIPRALDAAGAMKLGNPHCRIFPHFMMPRIIMEGFLISAAVLKAHSLADGVLGTADASNGNAPGGQSTQARAERP